MNIIHLNADNLTYWQAQSTPTVMALGFFDGVHEGHKRVIQTAGEIAKEKHLSFGVMSFFPHPKTILSQNNSDFNYLMPLSKKASILETLGVDTFYVVNCDRDFLSLLPEQFVSSYLQKLHVKHAVAGFDFSYGHRAAGNINRLKADSSGQIDVTKVDKVNFNGNKISSTWIRELVFAGEMELLANILGRSYETEVIWNGEHFQLAEHYLLPAPGTYKAVIEANKKVYQAEIVVSEQNETYLSNKGKHDFIAKGNCNITWLRREAASNLYHKPNAYVI